MSYEDIGTTRIQDLQQNAGFPTIKKDLPPVENMTYTPLMPYKHPYGFEEPKIGETIFDDKQKQLDLSLHARDINISQSQYTQDPQSTPNYVPAYKGENYVNADLAGITQQYYNHNKARKQKWEYILNEIWVPIILALLFYLFELPAFNSLILLYFSFLGITSSEGTYNFNGLILKSILFGISYYAVNKVLNYLED